MKLNVYQRLNEYLNLEDEYSLKLKKGDYTIKDLKEYFRRRRMMNRYAKKTVHVSTYTFRTLEDKVHYTGLTKTTT